MAGVPQALIQWKGASAASATWEDTAAFRAKYPAFQLEDELSLGGEGDVMFGRKYTRRRRARDVRGAQERAEQLARGARDQSLGAQGQVTGAGSTSG
jgi:ketosteroid isomerase-like protein